MDTESTTITSDGTPQPRPPVDDAEQPTGSDTPSRAADSVPGGAGTSSSSSADSATPVNDAGGAQATGNGTPSADAAPVYGPPETAEMPAVPADVKGLDDASTPTTGSTGSPSFSPSFSPSPSPSEAPAAAAPEAKTGSGGSDLMSTTEMPRIDTPAPTDEPTTAGEVPGVGDNAAGTTNGSGGSNRAIYEVRAAPGATTVPPVTVPPTPPVPEAKEPKEPKEPEAELPVTEQVPAVTDRTEIAPPRLDQPTKSESAAAAVAVGAATVAIPSTTGRPRGAYEPTSPILLPERTGVPGGPIGSGERPAHSSGANRVQAKPAQSRGKLVAILAPVVVVLLLIVAWAADSAMSSGTVGRNVEVAGRQIGGKSEDDLPGILAEVATESGEREVTIEVEGREPYVTTAATLGLVVDEEATVAAALDVGRGDMILIRPFKWVTSFFSSRDVPLEYEITETQTAATLQLLQGGDRTAPTEPTIQLTDGGFVAQPGHAGSGINASELASDLKEAAEASPSGAITLEADLKDEEPKFTDADAEELAERANTLTAEGISLKADTSTVAVPAQQLRSWVKPTVAEGKLDLTFDKEKATAEVPGLFTDLSAEPVNAKMTLEGGAPKVVPGHNAVACCGDNAADLIWAAVRDEKPEATLEVETVEPEITTEEVEGWGIKEPIGGSRGYQNGAEGGANGPGFTTHHDCCAARVTNIHRIADIIRGTVIPPGETFSVNDTVGERTTAKGFVPAGAISEGVHVDEVGGGISQFATTTFNAAYFAGLDIDESQSHTEWFSRYPRGREATMGYPSPDLVFTNNTPYGVMIWTSYTDTSLTVTMYSTQYATAEQTGSSQSMNGVCEVVTTTRTRTYPDRDNETDTFTSTYRPTGKFCDGSSTEPEPEEPPPPPG
jgi:vancomycin resistance protein YoaR